MLLEARIKPEPSPCHCSFVMPSLRCQGIGPGFIRRKISHLFLPHFLSNVSMIRACHAEDLAWTARSF